jgi:hypothetical protein
LAALLHAHADEGMPPNLYKLENRSAGRNKPNP